MRRHAQKSGQRKSSNRPEAADMRRHAQKSGRGNRATGRRRQTGDTMRRRAAGGNRAIGRRRRTGDTMRRRAVGGNQASGRRRQTGDGRPKKTGLWKAIPDGNRRGSRMGEMAMRTARMRHSWNPAALAEKHIARGKKKESEE